MKISSSSDGEEDKPGNSSPAKKKVNQDRTYEELANLPLPDISDLPIEVASRIWKEAILDNDLYYEEAVRLAKTFRQLNWVLSRPATDRDIDPVWTHFWMKRYSDEEELVGEEEPWAYWLGTNLPSWAANWKTYFFWSYYLEKQCAIALGKAIWDEMEYRYEKEVEDDEELLVVGELEGPVHLFKRETPVIPVKWSYSIGHKGLFRSITYTYTYKDGSKKQFGDEDDEDDNFESIMHLFPRQFRYNNHWYPVYMMVWRYIDYFNGYGDHVAGTRKGHTDRGVALLDYFNQRYYDFTNVIIILFMDRLTVSYREQVDEGYEYFDVVPTRGLSFATGPYNPREDYPDSVTPGDFILTIPPTTPEGKVYIGYRANN